MKSIASKITLEGNKKFLVVAKYIQRENYVLSKQQKTLGKGDSVFCSGTNIFLLSLCVIGVWYLMG